MISFGERYQENKCVREKSLKSLVNWSRSEIKFSSNPHMQYNSVDIICAPTPVSYGRLTPRFSPLDQQTQSQMNVWENFCSPIKSFCLLRINIWCGSCEIQSRRNCEVRGASAPAIRCFSSGRAKIFDSRLRTNEEILPMHKWWEFSAPISTWICEDVAMEQGTLKAWYVRAAVEDAGRGF